MTQTVMRIQAVAMTGLLAGGCVVGSAPSDGSWEADEIDAEFPVAPGETVSGRLYASSTGETWIRGSFTGVPTDGSDGGESPSVVVLLRPMFGDGVSESVPADGTGVGFDEYGMGELVRYVDVTNDLDREITVSVHVDAEASANANGQDLALTVSWTESE